MQGYKAILFLTVAAASGAVAQPLPPSPYDVNPECTRRSMDTNAPECLLQREGEPRQTYPPPQGNRPDKPQPPPQPPATPPAKQRDFKSPVEGKQLR